jgi:hypothetical protein
MPIPGIRRKLRYRMPPAGLATSPAPAGADIPPIAQVTSTKPFDRAQGKSMHKIRHNRAGKASNCAQMVSRGAKRRTDSENIYKIKLNKIVCLGIVPGLRESPRHDI